MIVVIEVSVIIAFKTAAMTTPSIAPPRLNPPVTPPLALDQARAAHLDVFDLAVRDIGPERGEHQQPVLGEPHVTPSARRDRRFGDVPAEVHQIAQAGDGAGVELEHSLQSSAGVLSRAASASRAFSMARSCGRRDGQVLVKLKLHRDCGRGSRSSRASAAP